MQVEDFERETIILYSGFSQEILSVKRRVLSLPRSTLPETVIALSGEPNSESPLAHQLFSDGESCGGMILTILPSPDYEEEPVIVSYLLQGLSWSPSYLMIVDENGVLSFQGMATVQNQTQKSISAKKLFLATGDVRSAHRNEMMFAAKQVSSASSSFPQITQDIEGPDVDYYRIDGRRLENGITQFPFLDSDAISLGQSQKFYYVDIHEGQAKSLGRITYEIYANDYLQGGSIVAYSVNYRLVGMSLLPTIPPNSFDVVSLGTSNRVYVEYYCTTTRLNETQVRVDIKGNITNITEAPIRIKFRYHLERGTHLISQSQEFDTVGEYLQWGAPIEHGTKSFHVNFVIHSPNFNFQ